MKIVITGANSFIGRSLSELSVANGWETWMVMRPEHEKETLLGATFLPLSFEDYPHLGDLTGSCDCFVHLAWNGTRGAARMDAALQRVNAEVSLETVKSVLGAGCRRIITAGSQAEYGAYIGKINETMECRPNTEYGKAKLNFYLRADALCQSVGAECREPRFFSLYGPNDYSGTMVMSILRNMLENRACKLTQCIQKWDFLFVKDAAEALWQLCVQACPNGIYNFGSGDSRRLKDYVLEMAELTGTSSELCFGTVPYPKTGVVSLWPDVSKLMRELNWKPQTTFAAGIRALLNMLKATEHV